MHPINEFYLGLRKTERGFDLPTLWNLSPTMIGLQYFYIEWLFPVNQASKWNKHAPLLLGDDLNFFKQNEEIQKKYLTSFDKIIHYFGIYREGNTLFISDELKVRSYWLREVGHEEKKISRIIRSLAWCGHLELARNLQKLSIELIKEKGYLKEGTLTIWQNILDEYQK